MNTEFQNQLKAWADRTERALKRYLPVLDNPQKEIYEAMRYSLLAGGKRIRPVLAFAAAEVLHVDADIIEPFACAIEMIHTYSLIHDDLPAMDNDDYRRGKPTCHKQFGEATAILAGDGLLNKAFEIMCSNACALQSPEAALRIMRNVAVCSGTEGMIGGQVVDLKSEGKQISEATLLHMYRCKTGALLKAPVLVAIAAKGCEETEEARLLLRYAELIGLAFQIKDDILDIEGSSEKLGKKTGRDEKEHKTTYVTLNGLEKSRSDLAGMTAEAVAIGAAFGERGTFLRALAAFLLERDH